MLYAQITYTYMPIASQLYRDFLIIVLCVCTRLKYVMFLNLSIILSRNSFNLRIIPKIISNKTNLLLYHNVMQIRMLQKTIYRTQDIPLIILMLSKSFLQ